MDEAKRPAADATRLRLAALPPGKPHQIRLEPDAATRAALAEELGLTELKKLRLGAVLRPEGARDWRLEGRLGASLVQPCVATAEPVTTRIDAPVLRRYVSEMPPLPEGDEIEMPEDDSVEELPATLDLSALIAEELALNVPAYPRADDAPPVDKEAIPPGAEPLTEDRVKPFAALSQLQRRRSDDET